MESQHTVKGNTRLLFWGGAALIALVVIGMVLQAIRNLLWDLSYWLPAWMVGPVLLLGAAVQSTPTGNTKCTCHPSPAASCASVTQLGQSCCSCNQNFRFSCSSYDPLVVRIIHAPYERSGWNMNELHVLCWEERAGGSVEIRP